MEECDAAGKGGVFVAAGDVVDIFDTFKFGKPDDYDDSGEYGYKGGVLAFGHLSPFEYAELHGTFVIDSTTANGTNDRLLDCTSFRHKYKKQDLLELETKYLTREVAAADGVVDDNFRDLERDIDQRKRHKRQSENEYLLAL